LIEQELLPVSQFGSFNDLIDNLWTFQKKALEFGLRSHPHSGNLLRR
jgi:hypothetical protein